MTNENSRLFPNDGSTFEELIEVLMAEPDSCRNKEESYGPRCNDATGYSYED